MKLVIFGLSVSSSWGNGHATIWRGLCRALGDRGHDITFFERDVPYYAMHRDLTELPGGALILYEHWNDVRARAAAELSGADAGIVTSYCPDGIAASEAVLDSRLALRVFYDLDTPVTLDHVRNGRAVPWLGPRGLRDFDLVLSYTGGQALRGLQAELGAREVAPLYGSVDPHVHRPVSPQEDLRSDLSYLGTWAADRQAGLEALFIEPARRLPHLRFLLGGSGYPADFPWADNIWFRRHLAPAEHPAFYCSSRLTLNVTRAPMAQMGFCPSGRLFEAAACGTPILSDPWEGLDAFYTPGSEILIARTTEDAVHALHLSPSDLQRISRAARERTLDMHTADCRAREMEIVLEAAGRRPHAGYPVPADRDPSSAYGSSPGPGASA